MKKKRKRKTPKFFRITGNGKWFIFITVTLGVAAINTGNNLIYLCFAMNLSLIITSGILSDLATRKVTLKVTPTKNIFAGKRGKILVTITNKKKILPIFYLRVITDPVRRSMETVIPYVGPGSESNSVTEGIFAKRGIYNIDKISVMTRFPFGFFEKYYHISGNISVVVFPHPAPVSSLERATLRCREEESGFNEETRTGISGHSLKNIREFVPSDPVKMVLWKKFMYTKKLYVKELDDEIDHPAHIEVVPEEDGEKFERQLESLAGKIVSLRSKKTPFILKLKDIQISSSDYPTPYQTALSMLSVIEKDGMGRGKIDEILSIIRK